VFTSEPQRPAPTPGSSLKRLRLFVADLAICKPDLPLTPDGFSAGKLVACTFHVKADAPLGDTTVQGDRNNLGNTQGVEIPSTSAPGIITVQQGPTPTPTITLTPTNTPTPIPCVVSGDCPQGQVCGPDGLCRVPTPTPTPRSCETTEQCEPGEICVGGKCKVEHTPTPTITPTPLPTCTTDEQCGAHYALSGRGVCAGARVQQHRSGAG
jgi:hypothetical protein